MMLQRLTFALAAGAMAMATSGRAAAEPPLWKIEGRTATVYLFGTMHLLKADTQWRSAKFDAAFDSADVLWEELRKTDDIAAAQPLLAKYGFDRDHPLSGKLDVVANGKLEAAMKLLGQPMAQIQPLRPWFAALNLKTIQTVKAGYDPHSGVDIVLEHLAADKKKPTQGFETIEQQMKFFADLPQAQEVEYLLSSLDDILRTGTKTLDEGVDAWVAGDTSKLESLLNSNLRDRYPALYKILITERNHAIADKIGAMLKGKGIIFVAIGEGHLVGGDSVQADLAQQGITAVRQ